MTAHSSMPDRLAFEERHFENIAATVRQMSGIDLPDRKKSLVYSRLIKRVRELGLASFDEYCELIRDKEGRETEHLLSSLTTNVTRFFREPHHFEYLEKELYPNLLDRPNRGRRVRLWSAGCSSGEEAYSLAISVRAAFQHEQAENVRILATDIDHQVIGRAEIGEYPKAILTDIPARLSADRYLDVGSETVTMGDKLRHLIRFRHLNLIGDWPLKGPFDVIFCRNVAIYFDQETQRRLWSRFESVLAPGGVLAIGHSERVSGPALADFENVGITTYRKRGGNRPPE